MAQRGTAKLTILWESEVRAAAQLLAGLRTPEAQALDEKAFGRLVGEALNACAAALYGAEDPSRALLLSTPPSIFPGLAKAGTGDDAAG